MNRSTLLVALFMTAWSTAFAQVKEKPTPARPAENEEVKESSLLRKSLEKKQLDTAPVKVAENTSQGKEYKQVRKNRSKKYCKKKGV